MDTEELTTINRRTGRAIWIVGAIVIALATLTPSGQSVTTDRLCLICGELGGVDALLNLLLFIPLGFGLALAGVRARLALPAMFAGTLVIEMLQVVAISGRDASLGDLTWNALGGVIGFALGAHLGTLLRPECRIARRLLAVWLSVWLIVQLTASYSLLPAPSDALYFGQIGRAMGGMPPYPGRVLSATLDGDTVPDFDLPNSGRARELLARDEGAELQVVVLAANPTSWLSSIVRIADQEQREILQLAGEGPDLIFGIRTAAARLRVRPLTFRLRHTFPGRAPNATSTDSVRIQARYALQRVTMSAVAARRAPEAAIPVTPANGWRLISPTHSYVDGSSMDALLNAAWLSLLLAPAGYLMVFARGRPVEGRPWPVLFVALAVVAGFAIAPVVFHLASPAWTEVAGAAAGLLTGALAARRMHGRISPEPELP